MHIRRTLLATVIILTLAACGAATRAPSGDLASITQVDHGGPLGADHAALHPLRH